MILPSLFFATMLVWCFKQTSTCPLRTTCLIILSMKPLPSYNLVDLYMGSSGKKASLRWAITSLLFSKPTVSNVIPSALHLSSFSFDIFTTFRALLHKLCSRPTTADQNKTNFHWGTYMYEYTTHHAFFFTTATMPNFPALHGNHNTCACFGSTGSEQLFFSLLHFWDEFFVCTIALFWMVDGLCW